jgi:hypothetical protein
MLSRVSQPQQVLVYRALPQIDLTNIRYILRARAIGTAFFLMSLRRLAISSSYVLECSDTLFIDSIFACSASNRSSQPHE